MTPETAKGNGLTDGTMNIAIAIAVALLFIGAATMVYLSLGQPDQAGIVVPLLLGLVGVIILGVMAVVYASRSVTIASRAVEIAERNVEQTQFVAGRIDHRMDEVKELIRALAYAEGKAEGRSEQKIEGGAALVVPAVGLPPVQAESVTIDAVNVNVTAAPIPPERAPSEKPDY